MKMNFKPAFRYQFGNYIRGSVVVFLIIFLIVSVALVFSLSFDAGSSNISVSGYSFAAIVFLFVMGIVSIRNDLRLCLQFGVSRRTAFLSELLAVMAVSVIIVAAGELLNGIARLLIADNEHFFVGDFYQIIYLKNTSATLTFAQHAQSALMNFSLVLSACLSGMFFSLLFWRLSRTWTIIVAVAIPLLINLVPVALYRLGVNLKPFILWLASSPYYLVLFALA
ncbi:MAG: hypothetical protein QMB62_07700, partial [Oscillospiraceae bacterium]